MDFIVKIAVRIGCSKSVLLGGLVVVLLSTVSLFASGKPEEIATWQTDYGIALASAQTQEKNIFLIFSGLAGDTVSQTLKTNIFDTDEFKKAVGKDYVLLNIDVGENTETDSEEIASKNSEVALQMGVQTDPATFLETQERQPFAFLLTKTGQPFVLLPLTLDAKLPVDLIALVEAEDATAKKITSLYKNMEMAEGIDRAKAIDTYVDALPEQFIPLEFYVEILEMDPENTTGLLGKYKLRLAHTIAAHAYATGDVDTALSSFLSLVDEPNLLTALEKQDAYYNTGYYAVQSGKVPMGEAIAYLQQAYNAAPDSGDAPAIKILIGEFGGAE